MTNDASGRASAPSRLMPEYRHFASIVEGVGDGFLYAAGEAFYLARDFVGGHRLPVGGVADGFAGVGDHVLGQLLALLEQLAAGGFGAAGDAAGGVAEEGLFG